MERIKYSEFAKKVVEIVEDYNRRVEVAIDLGMSETENYKDANVKWAASAFAKILKACESHKSENTQKSNQ